ncbi:uncharacterized protein N7518_007736 [Penicillium psychrosexuale]|uniref:uncharacterized protein n=1 Tax=Penicillium psychrosexuale TaxID=1002107 RepID=UPI002544DB1C|nr:uncharacterized protein N7518_007736 [Penicillium psychrosexuale]KAJ5790725.1 hypothetical protein N7518_007736 [Penicillium psychrosexuale]
MELVAYRHGPRRFTASRFEFYICWGAPTPGSEDSLVVTHPTTNSPACGLCAASSSVGVAGGERRFTIARLGVIRMSAL